MHGIDHWRQFVMVMEFVEGVTIESLLKRGPIPVPNAIDYVDQAADALGFAHRKGIVHRDIKPANMMLMSSGTVKLMDFGIARGNMEPRLTETGATVGTLYYMSPEQIMGHTVDARSDLYSLGISLYEMVTGTVPFKSESGYQILTAHLNEAPRRPIELNSGMPVKLNEMILKLLAKKPEDRYQTAEEFRTALKAVLTGAAETHAFQGAWHSTSFEQPTVPAGGVAGSGAGGNGVFGRVGHGARRAEGCAGTHGGEQDIWDVVADRGGFGVVDGRCGGCNNICLSRAQERRGEGHRSGGNGSGGHHVGG